MSTKLKVNSNEQVKQAVSYLIKGHFYGEDRREITTVMDRTDTLDLLKEIDTSLYSDVSIELEGEYFYITSNMKESFFYIESVKTTSQDVKTHEGEILLLPHYLPQDIKAGCVDNSETVIEFELTDVYEEMTKIINK